METQEERRKHWEPMWEKKLHSVLFLWSRENIQTSWRLCDDKLVLVLVLKADSSDLI